MKTSDTIFLVICIILVIGSLVLSTNGYRNATANDLQSVIDRLERIESKVDKLNHSR